MKKPLVSIVIPVYNGSKYLGEAIDSALEQTYKNIEIVVINDGSKDNGKTRAVAKSYGDKIRYYEKENGGVSSALNYAIKMSKGQFISWVSHDDKILPEKIELQIEYLIKNNLLDSKVILYSDHNMINKDSKFIESCQKQFDEFGEKYEYALLNGRINGITMLIPKKAFEECGLFNETLVAVQDYEMWDRMFKKYYPIHMPLILSESRHHSKQVTNVSPKVLTEGNPFWIKQIKNVPDKRKIELEGSLYNFYDRMARFLETTPYEETKKYCLDKCKDLKEKQEKSKLDDKVAVVAIIREKEKFNEILDDLKQQTYKNIEIIVVNKSTEKLNYVNVKEIDFHDNNWLKELKKVISSEYITFISEDEKYKSNKIEEQLSYMKLNNAKISFTNTSHNTILRKIINNKISYSSMMLSKKLLTEFKTNNLYIDLLELAKKNYLFEIDKDLVENQRKIKRTELDKYMCYKSLLTYCSNDEHYRKNDNLLAIISKKYIKYANKVCRVDEYNTKQEYSLINHIKKSIIMDGYIKTIKKIIKKLK